MARGSRAGSTGLAVAGRARLGATMPEPSVDAKTNRLFAPDTLLAAQYFDRVRRPKSSTGEQRLMIAILEQAVDDYMTLVAARDCVRQRMFADAEQWLASTDRSRLYSFETICDHLGLDVDYMRQGLRRWKARARGQLAPSIAPADVAPQERRRASNE
jgi:hypothetical protein